MGIGRRAFLKRAGAAATFVGTSVRAGTGSRLIVTNPRTAELREPLDVGDPCPMFFWIVEGPTGCLQTAFHVVVARDAATLLEGKGDLWDSGRQILSKSTDVRYAGQALATRQRCWWRVRIWATTGAGSAWSETAAFETGLVENDWSARWLAVESAEDRDDRLSDRTCEAEHATAPAPHWNRVLFMTGPGRLVGRKRRHAHDAARRSPWPCRPRG